MIYLYRVVDARNYVAPGADRPAAAARALAEYSLAAPPIVSIDKSSDQNHTAFVIYRALAVYMAHAGSNSKKSPV